VLKVTDHAVERFIQRWRPGMPFAEGRARLEELVARAAATRRKTLLRDARVYTVLTDAGERIEMAVRDGVVVTVLDAESDEARSARCESEDQAALIDARDDEEARKAAKRAVESAAARKRASEHTIADWKAGASFSKKALQRAREVLQLRDDEPARLRFEGGALDGVCVEVRPGEPLEKTLVRLREAIVTSGRG
jgi:hypothetical protein